MNDDLELRVAWQRSVAGRSADGDEWFERVLRCHRSADRHYHGVRHVTWVIRAVHDLAAQTGVDELDPIVAAAFFHDAIYDPSAHDNESRSADMARSALADLGWAPGDGARVADMIEATHDHDPATTDMPTAVLIAADLAVLAADASAYADYARAVRKEYHHVSNAAWAAGRSSVIDHFLQRPHVFPAVLGLDDWERRARANLTAELASLSRGESRDGESAHEP